MTSIIAYLPHNISTVLSLTPGILAITPLTNTLWKKNEKEIYFQRTNKKQLCCDCKINGDCKSA